MKRLVPSHLYGDPAGQLEYFTVRTDGCWTFTGYIAPTGYGQLGRNTPAHRVAWQVANGRPVPDGLHVDHLCHNADPDCNDDNDCLHRRCVNPAHLEAVTPRINLIRGKGFGGVNDRATECPEGHEYTAENTYWNPGRYGRQCRQCRYNAGVRQHRQRGRALARPDSPIIRAWAVANGIPVADRGAIPKHLRELYEATALEPLARAG